MRNFGQFFAFAALLIVVLMIFGVGGEEEVEDHVINSNTGSGKPCTFFGEHRLSQAESSLINCSWYKSNSCCKRTEVTSVFSGMMKLKGASKYCSNLIHYMMCYFCSPHQAMWYTRRVIVCARFCETVYNECFSATFNGIQLRKQYESGRHFCEEGQNFEVVDQTDHCFDYDPTVFSGAATNAIWWLSSVLSSVISSAILLRS